VAREDRSQGQRDALVAWNSGVDETPRLEREVCSMKRANIDVPW
jgi:hypothetical protein